MSAECFRGGDALASGFPLRELGQPDFKLKFHTLPFRILVQIAQLLEQRPERLDLVDWEFKVSDKIVRNRGTAIARMVKLAEYPACIWGADPYVASLFLGFVKERLPLVLAKRPPRRRFADGNNYSNRIHGPIHRSARTGKQFVADLGVGIVQVLRYAAKDQHWGRITRRLWIKDYRRTGIFNANQRRPRFNTFRRGTFHRN